MTAPTLPQKMARGIALGHCFNCSATTYVVAVRMRRHDDKPLCSVCIETHLETQNRERRAVQR